MPRARVQNLTYQGDWVFREASEPAWTGGGYKLDEASVLWRGATHLTEKFLGNLRDFEPMPGFRTMFLDSTQSDAGALFTTVEKRFIGMRGAEPKEHAEDSKTVQSLQSSVTPSSGVYSGQTVSLDALYRASRTTWTWFQKDKPAPTPKYYAVRNPADPLKNIIKWRVTDQNGVVGTLDLGTFTQLLNTLTISTTVNDYTVSDIVPDAIWQCQSIVDYTLQGA